MERMVMLKLERKALGRFFLFFSFGLFFASVVLGYWMHNTMIADEWLINYGGVGYVPLANWVFGMVLFIMGFMLYFYEPSR